jgi:hypothetical protein
MFNTRTLQGIIVLVIGVFLAIWLGLSIATNQVETIIKVIAALVLIGCLFLGRRIWLLIPFAAALNIGLRLPGNPDSLLVSHLLVLGFSTLLLLMRKLPYRLVWTELEFWVLILTLFVAQVYMRNPVGMNVFGGDTVGGRPYVVFMVGVVSALLIAGLRVPIRELKWMLPLSIIGGVMNLAVAILGAIVPAIGYYTGASFTRSDEPNYENFGTKVDDKAATRVGFAARLGQNLSLWISSYISPIRACIRPLWAVLVLVAIGSALFSGFRNGIMTLGFTFLVGIAYRNGPSGILLSSFAGFAGVVLLALTNLIHPLPPNIQRSLTFVPGTWEQRYKDDAKGSTEWRVEMWKEALSGDRWIRNKWLGDGLGFSAEDFQKSFTLTRASNVGGLDAHREQALINGDYHSGPVSTIKVIGYAGLLVFLIAQIRLGVHAHRQILRCKGTEWLPLALFIGIPLIYGPFFFVFVFGAFKGNAAAFLLSYSMVRLLENNLPLPAYVPKRRTPYLLNTRSLQPKSAIPES